MSPAFDPAAFATTLAVIGAVIIAATLLSGLIDRKAVPSVAVFLVLGLALGPMGLGLLDVGTRSAALGAIATISLTLVLFTDALGVDRGSVIRNIGLAAVVLGPGSLISALIIGLSAWLLLDLPPVLATILGAALASTDPVMMRGLLRRPGVPAAARVALSLESGLNDVVLLPIVLIAMAFMGPVPPTTGDVAMVGVNVFLLGPLIGGAIGFFAVRSLEWMRARVGLRRDYESLYVLGVAFASFAAAEMLHASGFMAAFTAGLVVAMLDVDLCDCFREYGEATSEMFLLFAFVALGTSLMWEGFAAITPAAVGFAVIALFARSAVLSAALLGVPLSPDSRRYVTWFGPRGLSALLLVLLPVFAGFEAAERLFPLVALVVLMSIVLHGVMLIRWNPRLQVAGPDADPELISIAAYRDLVSRESVRLLDVRAARNYRDADLTAAGAIRVDPETPVESAAALALPKNDWLIAYCA